MATTGGGAIRPRHRIRRTARLVSHPGDLRVRVTGVFASRLGPVSGFIAHPQLIVEHLERICTAWAPRPRTFDTPGDPATSVVAVFCS